MGHQLPILAAPVIQSVELPWEQAARPIPRAAVVVKARDIVAVESVQGLATSSSSTSPASGGFCSQPKGPEEFASSGSPGGPSLASPGVDAFAAVLGLEPASRAIGSTPH